MIAKSSFVLLVVGGAAALGGCGGGKGKITVDAAVSKIVGQTVICAHDPTSDGPGYIGYACLRPGLVASDGSFAVADQGWYAMVDTQENVTVCHLRHNPPPDHTGPC